MNQLALVVVEKATEKFASGETESVLKEGGQHHNFIGGVRISSSLVGYHWRTTREGRR
jgi:hypothetical protein